MASDREFDYEVTVCAACKCASCWSGKFVCDDFGTAGTTRILASKLDEMFLEH